MKRACIWIQVHGAELVLRSERQLARGKLLNFEMVKKRYMGKGCFKDIAAVNEMIGPALIDQNLYDPNTIDRIMVDLDGTENKEKLGFNAILAIFLASAKAASIDKNSLYQHNSKLPANKKSFMNPGWFQNIERGMVDCLISHHSKYEINPNLIFLGWGFQFSSKPS